MHVVYEPKALGHQMPRIFPTEEIFYGHIDQLLLLSCNRILMTEQKLTSQQLYQLLVSHTKYINDPELAELRQKILSNWSAYSPQEGYEALWALMEMSKTKFIQHQAAAFLT